jgi:hypothetical protein
VSCRIVSIDEFAKIIPVIPPTVNKKIKPRAHSVGASKDDVDPAKVLIHLKILIPVGIAITIVAAVKYARLSTSIPTVNIWWAHTINPKNPIPIIA